MISDRPVITDYGMITPYGLGLDACWDGLFSRQTAIKRFKRFDGETSCANTAAVVPGLKYDRENSLVMQMLTPLFAERSKSFPIDARLFLATTAGEIDLLERSVLAGDKNADGSCPDRLLGKVKKISGVSGTGSVVSAACASSAIAVASGASAIISGECTAALVVAADSVSEFVFAGFQSLMALDKESARPFDKNRSGLSLGEAASFLLLMSKARAMREKRPVLGKIAGWGMTNDANHMTGPLKDGSGLAESIWKALASAGMSTGDIGSISAHGTGTLYNDTMEMRAFNAVFGPHPLPTYSIKGGIGHTLGAAGLIEVIVTLRSLREKVTPPTVNLIDPDDNAVGWVSTAPMVFDKTTSLSVNSGFGGVNCALLISK